MPYLALGHISRDLRHEGRQSVIRVIHRVVFGTVSLDGHLARVCALPHRSLPDCYSCPGTLRSQLASSAAGQVAIGRGATLADSVGERNCPLGEGLEVLSQEPCDFAVTTCQTFSCAAVLDRVRVAKELGALIHLPGTRIPLE